MHTAWSANFTCSASASAVEYTATDSRPISRSPRITRSAISPRLAMSTFLNIVGSARGDLEQRLAVLHRCAVLGEDADDRAADVGFDLVHQLHRLDDAEHLALVDVIVDRDVVRGVGVGLAIERADERRGHDVTLLLGGR